MIRQCLVLLVAAVLVGCNPLQPPPPEHLVAEKVQKLGGTITVDEESSEKRIIGVSFPALKATDAHMKLLRGLDQLQTLDVANSEVSDKGLSYVSGLSELHSLNLLGTQITDEGLKHLSRLKNLQTLDLSDTQVSDAGVAYLKNLINLKTLMLPDTNVTDDGISVLRKSLPEVDIIDASGDLANEL